MEDVKNVECKGCGASMNFEPAKVAMSCAFCGSEMFIDIPETEEQKTMRQDAEIILFQVEKDAAKEKFSEWIKKGLFKPSNLVSSFKEKEFEGAYIPFFKVTANAATTWNGRDKIVIREASEDEPAEYEYRERSGSHSDNYKDFIAATKGLEQSEVDDILPFDDNETKPYEQMLTAGYKFENPAMKQDIAEDKCRERIKEWERDACNDDVDELLDANTNISDLQSKLIMLPIWVLVYIYEEKPFRVLINGQSGTVSGQKPTSKLKIAIAIFLAAAIIAGIYFAVQYFRQ
ncbi:MAG: hypothetical protein GY754_39020 [bacterium]|nr:hypothetical protein [bacterium]